MKTINSLRAVALITVTAGCAGMFNKTPTTVRLVNMPPDYTVTDNGAPAEYHANYQSQAVVSMGGQWYRNTTSHGPTIVLDRTIAHDIVVAANGLSRAFHVDRGSIGAGWVWLDLTLGFGVGAIIDGMSGAWRSAQHLGFDGSALAAPVAQAAVAAPPPVVVAPPPVVAAVPAT
jgi:hypothetical protein